jgi:hypothetical protein
LHSDATLGQALSEKGAQGSVTFNLRKDKRVVHFDERDTTVEFSLFSRFHTIEPEFTNVSWYQK